MTQVVTQTERVLQQLKQPGRFMTSAQAKVYGIQRLAARIHELRESGVNILSTPFTNTNGNRAVKYTLARGRKTTGRKSR